MLAIISPIALVFLVLGIGVVVVLLKNSKWWDKTAKKITEEPNFSEPKTKDVITKIDKTKDALGKRAVDRGKQAEKLSTEKEQIETYLGDKGDTDKEEEDKSQ